MRGSTVTTFPCGIRDNRKKKDRKLNISSLFLWQREKDSNPHIRSQSPLCYHYTIPLCSLDEHLLLYQRFCICQELIANFPDFFILVPRAVFDLRFSGKAAWMARAGSDFREGRFDPGVRRVVRRKGDPRWSGCGRRETGARLGCFGGRKICFFFGFGENADSLLHFKLLYCIHQGFREEHRP